jgi:hypothetical protein
MKILSTLLLFISISSLTIAQTCLPDGFVFTTQSQVDSFQINNPGCSVIEGNVTIGPENSWDEIDISNLDSLVVLTEIQGDLIVWNNDILPNLTGLDSLTQIGGDLRIETNSSVENLLGLEQLTAIGGSLIIYGGNYITSLDGLDNLNTIGGDLQISYGNGLTDISALSNLNSMDGDLEINNNVSLFSLNGLENIDDGTINSLTITSNSILSICAIMSVCNYVLDGVGDVSISGNASGCNSEEQVIESCLSIGIDELLSEEIQLYPNPAHDILTISRSEEMNIKEVRIFSQMGSEEIREQNTSTIDVSSLAPGMYLLEIESDEGKMKAKIIIE